MVKSNKEIRFKSSAELEADKARKKKEVRKIIIIVIIVAIILVAIFSNDISDLFFKQILNTTLNTSSSNTTLNTSSSFSDIYGTVKGITMGVIESDKYSWFIKLLIFLGAIYILQLALSVMFDIVEILALLYLLGTKIIKSIKKLFRPDNSKSREK
jgi:hypothetical protein